MPPAVLGACGAHPPDAIQQLIYSSAVQSADTLLVLEMNQSLHEQ